MVCGSRWAAFLLNLKKAAQRWAQLVAATDPNSMLRLDVMLSNQPLPLRFPFLNCAAQLN